ncbi:MAG: type IV pilus modification PilV family protein [Trueperaceae bacterium]
MNKKGFTLPEVMMSLGIFAIGMVATLALQMSGFATTRKAEVVRQMTTLASSQLELERQLDRNPSGSSETSGPAVLTSRDSQNCDEKPDHLGCVVSVKPCTLAGTTISCIDGTVNKADLVGHYIRVTVSADRQNPISVETFVRSKL